MNRGPSTPVRPGPSRQFRSLRRFWWVVVLIVVLCLGGALFASASVAATYTGRSSLIVSSPNRAPEQDAVLVQGYVDYFNNGAYQAQVAGEAGLSKQVTLTARSAASSPILLIEATTSSPGYAQRAAAAVAEAFQGDINSQMNAQRKKQVDELEARILAVQGPDGDVNTSAVSTLRQEIADINQDTTNRLQQLQFIAGVSTNAPKTSTNIIFALFGGLILGVMSALGLARLSEAIRGRRSNVAPVGGDSFRT